MRAELKELYSLDLDLNLYWPNNENNFGFWVRAMIGPEDEEGAESFDIQICTPEWIKSKYSKNEVVFGFYMIIVFEYNLENIIYNISNYCHRCIGNDWKEISEKLTKIGYWEFECYKFLD